jgi:sugar lactone lactonase YvrE
MLERFEELAEGLNHPEGVCWDPVRGVVYAGGEGGEIYRVSLDGEVEPLASSGGSMLGLAVDGRGRVYACDAGRGEIVRLDPEDRRLETYARGPDGADLDTPNMAAFGPDGVLYVTCSGEQGRPAIVRVAPGGASELWTDAVPGYPNGCVVAPAGDALLVVEGSAERVVRVPIASDGSAREVDVVMELPDTNADGVALDEDHHLWVTLYRPDGLVRVAPDGREVLRIDDRLASTVDAPTNLAFAGDDLDVAVIANVGDRFLSRVDLGVRGMPLHRPEVP